MLQHTSHNAVGASAVFVDLVQVAGKRVREVIDLGATSHVVLPGHALRVEISSSNFPRHDRNPNTGRSPLVETELRVAMQRVFHDGRYPSHIMLPVVPG